METCGHRLMVSLVLSRFALFCLCIGGALGSLLVVFFLEEKIIHFRLYYEYPKVVS